MKLFRFNCKDFRIPVFEPYRHIRHKSFNHLWLRVFFLFMKQFKLRNTFLYFLYACMVKKTKFRQLP